MRFLPNFKKGLALEVDEGIGGLGFHGNRSFTLGADGTPKARYTIPEAEDPKEMFDYYYDKLYGDKGNNAGAVDDLSKKIEDLTKKLNEAKILKN